MELPLISPSNQWTVGFAVGVVWFCGRLSALLLPLLVLPLGLALLLLLLGLTRRRRGPVLLAVVVLWLFSTGLVAQMLWRLAEWPRQRRAADYAPQADAIVVLSGGRRVRHPAQPGPVNGMTRIVSWRIELFRAGRAPLLLFTRGQSPFQAGLAPEELYRREAIGLGVPADAIASTPPVRNTAEEAAAIRVSSRVLLSPVPSHASRPAPVLLVHFQWIPWGWCRLDPLMWLPDEHSRPCGCGFLVTSPVTPGLKRTFVWFRGALPPARGLRDALC